MKRVLIVEDDKLIAELERDYLVASNYEVILKMDGKEGLTAFMEEEFDLIILDVMLPGINGFELCRIMRKEKTVPIMMVTARRDDIDKIRGLGLGADDYMVKPFSPAELVARVNSHIDIHQMLQSSAKNHTDSVIVIRDLKIMPETRRVFMRDEEVHLVKKEFDLLLFLAENPDRVFSKDAIFERIWGLDAVGETSTVTVHINRIRDKIEKDSTNPEYVETVWGAGYRLRA